MKDHLPKIIIVSLLVLIVGVPVLLRPSKSKGRASDEGGEARLVIYTPHNEQIRYEIERAFNNWRIANGKPAVTFDWRSPGGTSDIRKGILSQYQAIIDREDDLDAGIGADLFFGGGAYDHGKVAGGIESDGINYRIVDDPQIDAALFEAAFPISEVGGEPLYQRYFFSETDANGEAVEVDILGWTGVTLSTFGIVFNRDELRYDDIPEPQTWIDLTDPRYSGRIALADPSHSGSIKVTYNAVLRREGWTDGWHTLRGIFANARVFATAADRVPTDVSHGDAAAGMCIDFYGRYQSGAVGGNRMGYADPIVDGKSMTAINADPVTLLRGANDPELAREFIAWLLTEDAQSLWQRATVETDDGLSRPDKYELRRMPIRIDMYTPEHRATWVDQEIAPFETSVAFPSGTPFYTGIIPALTQAMAIDILGDLHKAWDALNEAEESGHPNAAKMRELFYRMPGELTFAWPEMRIFEWPKLDNPHWPQGLIFRGSWQETNEFEWPTQRSSGWPEALVFRGTWETTRDVEWPSQDGKRLPSGLVFRGAWPDNGALAQHWHAIHHDESHPRYEDVVAVFREWSDRLNALDDVKSYEARRIAWRAFFQANYREVVRLGRE